MIVDDNVDAAEMLACCWRRRVTGAGRARRRRRRCDDPPDAAGALFLDIGLPDMDGYRAGAPAAGMPQTATALLVAVTGYGQFVGQGARLPRPASTITSSSRCG